MLGCINLCTCIYVHQSQAYIKAGLGQRYVIHIMFKGKRTAIHMKLNITLGLGNKINIALFWFEHSNNKINTD